MTHTYKEATLTEIRDILLRIERLLIRDADNATVDAVAYWAKRARGRKPCDVTVYPQHIPGMPDPPLPRVQTTWQGPQATAVDPAPRTWMHGGWIHATGFSMVGP